MGDNTLVREPHFDLMSHYNMKISEILVTLISLGKSIISVEFRNRILDLDRTYHTKCRQKSVAFFHRKFVCLPFVFCKIHNSK
jgi:hypothetical protein